MLRSTKPARSRWRFIPAVLAAVAAVAIGGIVVDGAVTSGPTRASVSQDLRTTDLGRVQLVVLSQVCKTQNYGDGVGWHVNCNTRDYSGGSTWWSRERSTWNIPPSAGHSDLINYAEWHYGTTSHSMEDLSDGETGVQYDDQQSSSGSTVWVEVKNNGSVGWAQNACRRTFFSADGGTSTVNC